MFKSDPRQHRNEEFPDKFFEFSSYLNKYGNIIINPSDIDLFKKIIVATALDRADENPGSKILLTYNDVFTRRSDVLDMVNYIVNNFMLPGTTSKLQVRYSSSTASVFLSNNSQIHIGSMMDAHRPETRGLRYDLAYFNVNCTSGDKYIKSNCVSAGISHLCDIAGNYILGCGPETKVILAFRDTIPNGIFTRMLEESLEPVTVKERMYRKLSGQRPPFIGLKNEI